MSGRLVVVALPGFTRQPRHLERLATAIQGRGWICLRPPLAPSWLPALYMSKRRLRRIADELAKAVGQRDVVVAGHSAGAAAGTYLAQCLRERGVQVRGLVLIDGVDSPNHLVARTLPALKDLRVAAVMASPSPCNRDGRLERSLVGLPQVRLQLIEGAGHGAIEGVGIPVYQRMCQDTTDDRTADLFQVAVLNAIDWAATGR